MYRNYSLMRTIIAFTRVKLPGIRLLAASLPRI